MIFSAQIHTNSILNEMYFKDHDGGGSHTLHENMFF